MLGASITTPRFLDDIAPDHEPWWALDRREEVTNWQENHARALQSGRGDIDTIYCRCNTGGGRCPQDVVGDCCYSYRQRPAWHFKDYYKDAPKPFPEY